MKKITEFSPKERITIVTGFLSDKIDEEIAKNFSSKDEFDISLVRNDIYEQGVITSLLKGLEKAEDNVIVLNGDTIYPISVFESLITVSKSTLLVFQAKNIPDSIRVFARNSTIIEVGKSIEKYNYISVGCFFLQMTHLQITREIIANLVNKQNVEKFIWHELINFLVRHGERIYCKEVREGNTFEVDTQEDYQVLLCEQRKNRC